MDILEPCEHKGGSCLHSTSMPIAHHAYTGPWMFAHIWLFQRNKQHTFPKCSNFSILFITNYKQTVKAHSYWEMVPQSTYI